MQYILNLDSYTILVVQGVRHLEGARCRNPALFILANMDVLHDCKVASHGSTSPVLKYCSKTKPKSILVSGFIYFHQNTQHT